VHPAVKHPRYDNREKSADDRSYKKYLKLIQMITFFVVIIQNSHYIRYQQPSTPSFLLKYTSWFDIQQIFDGRGSLIGYAEFHKSEILNHHSEIDPWWV
jgi:hypothetical protein